MIFIKIKRNQLNRFQMDFIAFIEKLLLFLGNLFQKSNKTILVNELR